MLPSLTDAEVLGTLLEELVDNFLDNWLLDSQWSWGHLLGHWLLLWPGLQVEIVSV